MSKKILALLFIVLLMAPSFAALKGLETTKEESIVKVGENAEVPAGAEIKSVVAVNGSVNVAGRVTESVVSIGGDVILQSTAVVDGDIVTVGGSITKNPGAAVKGTVTEVKLPAGMMTKGLGWGMAAMSILSFLAFLVLAVILVSLFGKYLGVSSYYVEKMTGQSLLWGFIALISSFLIVILLVISILGIPFIPLFLLLLAAAGIFGYVAIAQLIGKLIFKAFRVRNQPMATEVVTGMLLFFLIGFLPILGWIIKLLAWLMGLGAVAVTRFGTQSNCC